jgi:hypothetical protein
VAPWKNKGGKEQHDWNPTLLALDDFKKLLEALESPPQTLSHQLG